MRGSWLIRLLAVSALWGVCVTASAVEYRSVSQNATVLYDAPSRAAVPLFVLSAGYPLEVVVNLEAWVKVRDHTGALSWVERRGLADKRMVVVTAAGAEVRQKADDASPIAFHAVQFLALELVEVAGQGWIRVQHRDGSGGFLRANQVWGL